MRSLRAEVWSARGASGASCLVAPLLALALAWLVAGCCGSQRCFLKKPYPAGSFVVSDVVVVGNDAVSDSELLSGLATTQSPRFLGLAEGVAFDYEVFDETLLARDVQRIERRYRALGFYEAKVTATRVVQLDDRHVRVELQVDEGPPDPTGTRDEAVVITRKVTLLGIERLPVDDRGRASLAGLVLRAVSLEGCVLSTTGDCISGEPFEEAKFEASKAAIAETLANRGFAFVEVDARAEVDVARHVADITYEIEPGPEARFGPITIEGLDEIPERKVRAQMFITEGRRYSKKRLERTQEALSALGRFSSVELDQDLSRPESGTVPIRVRVREGKLRGVRAGVGASFDVLRLANSVLAGWEDRNFLGGMRDVRLEDRAALTYFPLRIGRPFQSPTRLLPENYFRATLRQPAFLERRTEGVLHGDVNVYPVLYRLERDADPEQERIVGFLELRGTAGVERTFFRRHFTVSPSYAVSQNWPIMYRRVGPDPTGLVPVLVTFPELFTDVDFRDDPISPSQGFRFINSVQLGGAFGIGDVTDVRINPDLRLYRRLVRRVTLAVRAAVGLLFPRDYGETLDPDVQLAPDDPRVIGDQAKLLFRVFYSGGPNSNRGYPYRGIGPHGPLGFLQPSTTRCEFNPPPDRPNPAVCERPLGGLTLWEASVELRFPIAGALGGVTFVDASDVTRAEARFRSNSPHLSPGLGVRYETPVGPLRVDVGWRAVRTFVKDDPSTPEDEPDVVLGDEPDPGRLLGLPIAVHISLGQAF